MVSYCLNDKGVFFCVFPSGEQWRKRGEREEPKRRKKITPVLQPAKLILK